MCERGGEGGRERDGSNGFWNTVYVSIAAIFILYTSYCFIQYTSYCCHLYFKLSLSSATVTIYFFCTDISFPVEEQMYDQMALNDTLPLHSTIGSLKTIVYAFLYAQGDEQTESFYLK